MLEKISSFLAGKPAATPAPKLPTPPFCEQTLSSLIEAVNFQTAPKIAARIAQLQIERDKLFKFRQELAKYRAGINLARDIESAGASLRSDLAGGKNPSATEEILTPGGQNEKFYSEAAKADSAMREILAEAVGLARPELARFGQEISKFIDDLESAERGIAAKFSVKFSPSETIKNLRACLERAMRFRIPERDCMMFQNPVEFCPPFKNPE